MIVEGEKMACYSNNGVIVEGQRERHALPAGAKMICKSNNMLIMEVGRLQSRWAAYCYRKSRQVGG